MLISKCRLAVFLLVSLAVFTSLVHAQTYRYGFITGTVTVTKTKYYVSQLSDVDSSADKGTHSNFTAQRYGPDLTNDTLTEENTGSGSGSLWLYVDSFDGNKTDWATIGSEPYLDAIEIGLPEDDNLIATSSADSLEGDFGFTDSGKSTETIINVTIQIYGHNTNNKSLEVYGWSGSSWTSLGNLSLASSNGWVNYTATTLLDTWTKIDGAKIYLKSSGSGTYNIDCARLQVDYDSTNYEADLEVQWTNVDFDEANEELCIYGGMMGSEGLRVDVWTGAAWQNVIAGLSSGWNNITVSAYLTSSTFTIRFKGAVETADATQDSWAIDATLLHVWT